MLIRFGLLVLASPFIVAGMYASMLVRGRAATVAHADRLGRRYRSWVMSGRFPAVPEASVEAVRFRVPRGLPGFTPES